MHNAACIMQEAKCQKREFEPFHDALQGKLLGTHDIKQSRKTISKRLRDNAEVLSSRALKCKNIQWLNNVAKAGVRGRGRRFVLEGAAYVDLRELFALSELGGVGR